MWTGLLENMKRPKPQAEDRKEASVNTAESTSFKCVPPHFAVVVEAAKRVAGPTRVFHRFDQVLEAKGTLRCPHDGGDQPGSTIAVPIRVDVNRNRVEPHLDIEDGRVAATEELIDLEQYLSMHFTTEYNYEKKNRSAKIRWCVCFECGMTRSR